ncbi:hypothetical protein FSARC_9515 [Fusarium sarcochroum]|uniref:Heterokaryon incompatibility domain-containing protein n=1 Tax=Fusarium sarcochroum TaxID=1208366 RepID=A0A8H4TQS8_9HYPO|nr:hypothetical protein FSARC_9515 [Fusarium sarcochroum]
MFVYKPLSQESQEFRLIRLCCTPKTKLINLELRHASVSDNVAYHAVSYVWGDLEDIAQVTVDGQDFSVSRNLVALLQQLLDKGVTAWLWTDSICINQADQREKAWQVNAMDQIYGNAKLVYLWLGPSNPQTDMSMELLHKYGRQIVVDLGGTEPWDNEKLNKQLFKALSTGKKPSPGTHQAVHLFYNLYKERGLHRPSEDRPLEDYPLLNGIRDLMERPFWRRVWIIQEVTLAQEALVMCGSASMPIEYISEAIDTLRQCTVIFSEFSNLSFLQGLGSSYFTTTTLNLREYRQRGEEVSLLHLLLSDHEGPRYLATEPRDLIFGLLSIVRERDSFGLRADYSEPVGRVFARATKSFIDWWPPTKDNDWDVTFTLDSFRPSNIPGLPSWTPDYESIGKNGFDIDTIKDNCAAFATKGAPSSQLVAKPDEDPMILFRKGCIVDTIIDVMEPFPDVSWAEVSSDTEDAAKACAMIGLPVMAFMNLGAEASSDEDHIWKTVMLTFQDLYDEDKGPPQDKDVHPDIWKFMRALFRGDKVDPNTAQNVRDQLDDLDSSDEEWEDMDTEAEASSSSDSSSEASSDDDDSDEEETVTEKMIDKFWNALPDLKGRTLFKTASGMLGMGRTSVKGGDIVTLIWDVPTPIILRPDGGNYLFLGDAYVDGIMKGEFLSRKPQEVVFDLA